MKACVDQETCIGCGLCASLCPQVFAMEGDKAAVVVEDVPKDAEGCAKDAAEQCPVSAIAVS